MPYPSIIKLDGNCLRGIIKFNDAVIDLLSQDEKSIASYVDYLDKYFGYEVNDVRQMSIALDI